MVPSPPVLQWGLPKFFLRWAGDTLSAHPTLLHLGSYGALTLYLISAYDTKHNVVFSMLSAQVLCGDIRKANN